MASTSDRGNTVSIGYLLRHSIDLVLDRWPLLVLSTLVLAVAYWLNLRLLAYCFIVQSVGACLPSEWAEAFLDWSPWGFRAAADGIAVVAVMSVALYFLYRGRREDQSRWIRLSGRIVFYEVILVSVRTLTNIGFSRINAGAWAHRSLGLTQVEIAAEFGVLSFLSSGLAFYAPSVAYTCENMSLAESWRQTRHMRRILVAACFAVYCLGYACRLLIWTFIVRPRMSFLNEVASTQLDLTPPILSHALLRSVSFLIVEPLVTLVISAIGIVAFRRIWIASDQHTTAIFG